MDRTWRELHAYLHCIAKYDRGQRQFEMALHGVKEKRVPGTKKDFYSSESGTRANKISDKMLNDMKAGKWRQPKS